MVRAAGAMVSMACGIQISCLAMKKAAMNAAIILNLGVVKVFFELQIIALTSSTRSKKWINSASQKLKL